MKTTETTIKEWDEIPFSDCLQKVKIGKEKQIKEKDYLKIGSFPIVDQGKSFIAGYTNDANKVISDIQPFIIFGDHTRILKYIDFPITLGADGTKVIKPKDNFDTKFFLYFLKYLNIPSRGYNRHFTILKEKNILRPPLPEQKSIAKTLTTIQDAIAGQKELIIKLKELKQSMMRRLFTHGTKGEKTKLTEIGEIPENWAINKASEFCDYVTDGTHDSPKKKDSGKYLVTSKNIIQGKIDFSSCYKISDVDFEVVNKRSKVDNNDVIFSMIGTLGEVAFIKKYNDDFCIKNVGLFKNKDVFKGKWIFYWLQSPQAKEFIRQNIGGSTQKYITLGCLRNFPVPIVENKESLLIIEMLDTLNKKIELTQAKLVNYHNLFKTLLHELMNDEINIEK